MKNELVELAKSKHYFSFHTINREVGDGWYIELCLLQKWLREKHNIDIVINPERYSDGINYTFQAQKFDLVNGNHRDNFIVEATYWYNDNGEYPSYKLALEKGLLEALKLIKDDTN